MQLNSSPRIGLRLIVLSAGLAFVLACAHGVQAQAQTASNHHLDSAISGFWEMHYDSLNAPPASLVPLTAKRREEIYKHNQYARRWCNAVGMPEIMSTYRPVDIEVGPQQVVVASEFVPYPRHIYTDRLKHNNPDVYDPDVVGDSIGQWEGDDLIVDTIGFSDGGITELPGGGVRTSKSTLAERFHPMNDGKNLLVTSTWYDPTIFTKPYTYSVYYYRTETQPGQPPYSAGEMACDPIPLDRDKLMERPTPVAMSISKPPVAAVKTPVANAAKSVTKK